MVCTSSSNFVHGNEKVVVVVDELNVSDSIEREKGRVWVVIGMRKDE
jgi:hypothetical protein